MLKIIIVDDEAPARERLKNLLSQNAGVELIGEAEDGINALELIEEKKPDLVLLDIQMPRLDGFGVVKILETPPLIIFVTAYDEYAIKAFEVNALDYLLKPFTRARLDRALEKAANELQRKTEFNNNIAGLFKTLGEQKRFLERIAVKNQDKIMVIDIDDIDALIAESGHITILVGDKQYFTNYSLNELQNRLDPHAFFRAHRSALVNLTKIKEIIPWFAGSYKIKLKTGYEVDLSRAQAPELKKVFGF
jgi:DNA-binding LytR/AlgR family response regulator